MRTLTTNSVLDSLTAELAERRRASMGRRAGYVALARAILDEQHDLSISPTAERLPALVGQSTAAACA